MSRNAHTWASKYSAAEKEACIRAHMIDGHSYREIARKAQAGELPGAGRMDITHNYVGKLCRAAKAETRPETLTQPGQAENAIERRKAAALALILRDLDRWALEAKTGQADLQRHGQLMRALALHEKTTRKTGQDEPGAGDHPHTNGTDALAQLLNAMQNGPQTNNNQTNPASPTRASHTRSGVPSA